MNDAEFEKAVAWAAKLEGPEITALRGQHHRVVERYPWPRTEEEIAARIAELDAIGMIIWKHSHKNLRGFAAYRKSVTSMVDLAWSCLWAIYDRRKRDLTVEQEAPQHG